MAYRHRDRCNHHRSLVVSGKVFRQWGGRGSGNGRNLVTATATGIVDSPVVELFAGAESMVLLLGNVALLEGCVFVFVAALASFLAGNIPCERSTGRSFQSRCA